MEYTKIQLRCDTLANWATYNPTLALGEFGYESDTKKAKIGDGLTPYNNLQYCFDVDKMTELYSALENVETIITDATGILQEVETATTNAITATANANTATTHANTATSSANTATANANSKITEMEGVIDDANDLLDEMETALGAMATATTNAVNATTLANTATTNANQAIAGANNATYSANQAAQNANTATANVSAKITDINNAIARANTATSSANTATANTEVAIREAYEARTETILATNEAISAITNAETATANAITATTNANTATANANTATTQANNAKNATIQATQNAITATTNANTATANANTATQNANTATANAQTATTNAINATNEAIEVTEAVDGRITELEETKANKDGYYKLLGVGVADDLAGRGDGVSATFTYRTAGGDADIADGTATIQSIKGNSIVWNQQVENIYKNPTLLPDSIYTNTYENGIYTLKSIVTEETTFSRWLINTNMLSKQNPHHSFLVMVNILNWEGFTTTSGMYIGGIWFAKDTINKGVYYKITNDFERLKYLVLQDDGEHLVVAPNAEFKVQYNVFDITQMFGEGNEPTIEEFKQWFPKDYYEYNAGEIINVNIDGLKTVGFNAFDITKYTNKDAGAIVEENKLTFTTTNNTKLGTINIQFYKNGVVILDRMINNTFTVPNYDYIRIKRNGNRQDCSIYYGKPFIENQTYYFNGTITQETINRYVVENVCFNLSWSGYRNGEYEPYWEYERNLNIENIMYDGEPLFPDGLKSVESAKDEVTSDKAIKRCNYEVITPNTEPRFVGSVNKFYICVANIDHKKGSSFICGNYPNNGASSSSALQQTIDNVNKGVYIYNDTNDTYFYLVVGINETPQPIKVCYELATPIEVEFDEPLNLTYNVSDFGTEEILPTNTATPTTTPFVGTILYGFNATDTLRRLPTEYLSINSLDSLINAFAPYFTITYNWDDNNNKYNFSITPVEPTNITE